MTNGTKKQIALASQIKASKIAEAQKFVDQILSAPVRPDRPMPVDLPSKLQACVTKLTNNDDACWWIDEGSRLYVREYIRDCCRE